MGSESARSRRSDRCPLGNSNEFIAYIDAIGQLDGERWFIVWKTPGARYPDEPAGLLALDPQLVCYSWITGEPNVGFVVFVRKRRVEVQYLRASVTQKQREDFGAMMLRLFRFLPGAQKQEFLCEVAQTV